MRSGEVQEWSVQCNTEGKYGQILVVTVVYLQKRGFKKTDCINIFCVFILYANIVCCSEPKSYQCIIKVLCYMFYWHQQVSVRLPK